MRQARFEVSTKLLEQALNLPTGAKIVGAVMLPYDGVVELQVEDQSLPEAAEPHDLIPTVTRVEWSWNLEEVTAGG